MGKPAMKSLVRQEIDLRRGLTMPQAAEIIGIATCTLYALIQRGEGPPTYRPGHLKSRRIRPAALEAWLLEQEQATAKAER